MFVDVSRLWVGLWEIRRWVVFISSYERWFPANRLNAPNEETCLSDGIGCITLSALCAHVVFRWKGQHDPSDSMAALALLLIVLMLFLTDHL